MKTDSKLQGSSTGVKLIRRLGRMFRSYNETKTRPNGLLGCWATLKAQQHCNFYM